MDGGHAKGLDWCDSSLYTGIFGVPSIDSSKRWCPRNRSRPRGTQGLEEPHTPLRDLFFHTTHLDALGNVGVPLLNLYEAALALASMQLYDGKGGDTRWHALLQ